MNPQEPFNSNDNSHLATLLKYRFLWLILPALLFSALFSIGPGHSLANFALLALVLYLIALLFAYQKALWLSFFALSLLPTMTTSLLVQLNSHQSFSVSHIVLFFFIFLLSLFLAYFLARWSHIIPSPHLKDFPLLKILLGLILLIAAGFLISLVGQATHASTTANQSALNNLRVVIPPAIFAAQTISAGFFEELAYRVAIFEIVLKAHPKLAFLAASVLFAYMHGPTNLYSWLTYGIMSLILTGFYYRYRNFYLNMSIHMLWNLLSLLVAFM